MDSNSPFDDILSKITAQLEADEGDVPPMYRRVRSIMMAQRFLQDGIEDELQAPEYLLTQEQEEALGAFLTLLGEHKFFMAFLEGHDAAMDILADAPVGDKKAEVVYAQTVGTLLGRTVATSLMMAMTIMNKL